MPRVMPTAWKIDMNNYYFYCYFGCFLMFQMLHLPLKLGSQIWVQLGKWKSHPVCLSLEEYVAVIFTAV